MYMVINWVFEYFLIAPNSMVNQVYKGISLTGFWNDIPLYSLKIITLPLKKKEAA